MATRCVILASLLLAGLRTGGVAADDAPELPDFAADVLPILTSRCVRCHGPNKQEARIRLDNVSTDLIADRAAATMRSMSTQESSRLFRAGMVGMGMIFDETLRSDY